MIKNILNILRSKCHTIKKECNDTLKNGLWNGKKTKKKEMKTNNGKRISKKKRKKLLKMPREPSKWKAKSKKNHKKCKKLQSGRNRKENSDNHLT